MPLLFPVLSSTVRPKTIPLCNVVEMVCISRLIISAMTHVQIFVYIITALFLNTEIVG